MSFVGFISHSKVLMNYDPVSKQWKMQKHNFISLDIECIKFNNMLPCALAKMWQEWWQVIYLSYFKNIFSLDLFIYSFILCVRKTDHMFRLSNTLQLQAKQEFVHERE